MACDHESQMSDASALCCIPPNLHAAVQSYLLAKIRGGSMDVGEILRDSACLSSCIPPGLMPRIKTYLMCQLSNAGGTPTPIPEPVCDADAQAFITTAGITVPAQQDAICRFVASLKSQGTPSFWDSEIVIYPFVGGTGPQHSYNLKDPTTYQLTYHGAAVPTHGPLGMLGNGVSGYANTHYVPRTGPPALNVNNCRVYVYFDSVSDAAVFHYGVNTEASANRLYCLSGVPGRRDFTMNDVSITQVNGANGGYIGARSTAASQRGAYNGGAFVISALVSSNTPTAEMLLLCRNSNPIFPAVIPSGFSASRISGYAIGNRFLDAIEWPIYHSIWQTFQAELGRQRP